MDSLALNIATLSTNMSTVKTVSDVNVAILKKEMNMEEEMSMKLVQMMERSVSPNLGANIDVKL